jgi:hypothetical protein
MTYYLYVKENGYGRVSDYPLNLGLQSFAGYTFVGATEEKLDVDAKRYVDGTWVGDSNVAPEYLVRRQAGYPSGVELCLALWKAMDAGMLPKVPGFYDKIKEVNDRFPPS